MQDLLYAAVFMSVVFALAALNKKSARLQRVWAIAFFVMALIALPVHAFGLIEEPLWQRLLYFVLAAVIVLNVLSGRGGFGGKSQSKDEGLLDDDEYV